MFNPKMKARKIGHDLYVLANSVCIEHLSLRFVEEYVVAIEAKCDLLLREWCLFSKFLDLHFCLTLFSLCYFTFVSCKQIVSILYFLTWDSTIPCFKGSLKPLTFHIEIIMEMKRMPLASFLSFYFFYPLHGKPIEILLYFFFLFPRARWLAKGVMVWQCNAFVWFLSFRGLVIQAWQSPFVIYTLDSSTSYSLYVAIREWHSLLSGCLAYVTLLSSKSFFARQGRCITKSFAGSSILEWIGPFVLLFTDGGGDSLLD